MVTWMGRYAAGLAVVGVLGAGLVGCTSSPTGSGSTGSSTVTGSGVSGSSTVTSGATSTATSTALGTGVLGYPADVPAEARVNSPAGAMAFARHFFAQVNKAYTTPQAGLIRPLSDASCLSCASFADNADGYVQLGQRYTTDAIKVLEVSLAPDPAPQDGLLVDLVARQQKATLIDSAGRVQDSFSEKEGVFLMNLRWSGQAWSVRKIQARQ